MIRLDIQGLRAIAVICVMIYHANEAWLPAGYLGVDIFFVISGFIISCTIFKDKENHNFSWTKFYKNRIKRIIPAYGVLLLVTYLISSVLFISKDFVFFKKSLHSAIQFTSNKYFASFGDYFAPSSNELPLLHTWSLALEMQFYLFLPILLNFIKNKHLKLVLPLLSLALLVWVEYGIVVSEKSLYFSLLARVPEFLAGVLVALFFSKKSLNSTLSNIASFIGLILLVLSLFLVKTELMPGAVVLFPCIGIVLILLSPSSLINRVLSSPVLVWIGGMSYSLYLWHWPILAYIRYYLETYTLAFPLFLIYFVLSFLLAWLSYKFIETPMRLMKSPKLTWIFSLIFLTVIFLIYSDYLKLNQKIVSPLPQSYQQYADDSKICHGKIVDSCFRGDPLAGEEILVIGDSHAAQLNFFFEEIGHLRSIKFKIMTASSCVPLPEFDIIRLPSWAQEPCLAQIAEIQKELKTFRKIIIASHWEYQTRSDAFIKIFENFLATNPDHKILVLAQVPMFDQDILRLNRFTELGLGKSLVENSNWRKSNSLIKDLVSKFPNVQFLDFGDSRFFENAPYFQGELIYHDSHHLNEVGSKLYGTFTIQEIVDFVKVF